MHILHSDWLIRMLDKSSKNPTERMLNMFDILQDWAQAPKIEVMTNTLDVTHEQPQALLDYLTQQSKLAHADQPDILAQQLCLMLQTTLQHAIKNPNNQALIHAKQVAKALIEAHLHPHTRTRKFRVYATIAASVGIVTILGFSLLQLTAPIQSPSLVHQPLKSQHQVVATHVNANPMQIALLLSQIEQMRRGNCQFPEALQIPDKHKNVYINTVVLGQAPVTLDELSIANAYLQKVRCNYTPMLMANSRS